MPQRWLLREGQVPVPPVSEYQVEQWVHDPLRRSVAEATSGASLAAWLECAQTCPNVADLGSDVNSFRGRV